MEKLSLIVRSLLSLIALLGLLYLESIARIECTEGNLTVYVILGGCILGLNGKEFAEVLGIIKNR